MSQFENDARAMRVFICAEINFQSELGHYLEFSALALTDDLLPLVGMFKDAKGKPAGQPNK